MAPNSSSKSSTELDRDGNELTPHFIARLGEQLHKEESALAPIQKWIEAKTGSHLADIILREHAEEANDLMFIIDSDRKFAAALRTAISEDRRGGEPDGSDSA